MVLLDPLIRHARVRPVLVSAVFAVVALAGCVSVPQMEDEMELYITDLPAGLERLDVEVQAVTVGGVALQIEAMSFDLAALQGPEDAILLAAGPAKDGPVEVVFASAVATIDGVQVPVDVSAPLRHDGVDAKAALFDVSLPDSLQETEAGLAFAPVLEEVYVLDTAAPSPTWTPLSVASAGPNTIQDAVQGAPMAAAGAGAETAVDVLDQTIGANITAAVQVPDEEPVGIDAILDAPDADAPTSTARTGWLVEFLPGVDHESMNAYARSSGGVFVFALKSLPAAYVLATEAQALDLASHSDVVRIEAEAPLEFHDAESRKATRMPALTHPITGLKDASGDPIDGRGVGVAVVDTGIYAAHIDLRYEPVFPGGVVRANYKVESLTYTDMIHTDTTSGHGTHVAAILAGQGVNYPDLRGVAPGVKLYGFGIGEASTTVWAAQAFDWIVQNHDQVQPPIKVVTNSWSMGTTYDPSSITNRLAARMVDDGLVVVFSAGNKAGNGATNQVSGHCQIPEAGILCVAAYDDLATGTRDGAIAPYSSRGLTSDTSTWPDISAPGTKILSARPPVGTTTGAGTSLGYVELSGTSQAAPQVAGVAALLLQADPDLSPAQVEAHIKASAYKFTDGGGYTNGSHYAKGAGLLDAYAAVDRVI